MKIMDEYSLFNVAVEKFLDSLSKKRDWQHLDHTLSYYRNRGWDDKKLKKVYQWERKAYDMYTKSNDDSLRSIKTFAHSLTPKDFLKLEVWIKTSKFSRDAWHKSSISINDSKNIIKARLIHLAYMAKAAKPVNIGNIIAKEE
jgi:hypothetical protein